MSRRRAVCGRVVALVLGTMPGMALAQSPTIRGDAVRTAPAIRVTGPAPRLDGRLDDEIWRRASFVSGFRQRAPDEGARATEETEIAFVFDERALYVGARMHSAAPGAVRKQLTRRDHTGNSEQIIISLDTHGDRRTAYSFGLTAAGVRLDYYHPRDEEGRRDYEFDPIWEGRVASDAHGWSAEMRIPFAQLRFSAGTTAWGINAKRRIPARNEDDFWIVVPRDETGWASRFGHLTGIVAPPPSRRIELLPYVATDATLRSEREPGNPFHGNAVATRIGGDLKAGLGPGLTLDATVNPDFGQVEADPADVNLSAFETIFSERRPFFTEGRELLEGRGPAYFYSRRIGAAPRGRASADFVDRPQHTTILGAAKVTGRLSSGLSLGALGAVTDREVARTFDETTEERGEVRVEPRSSYGVMRLQQEFGRSGSTAGVMLTAVDRDLEGGEPVSAVLARRAFSGGGDWDLRLREREYRLRGHVGFSHVSGDSLALLRLQRSSARYFQRPDARYVELDSSRTALTGASAALTLSRESGRHWLWEVAGLMRTPGLELNDAGRSSTVDDLRSTADLAFRETRRQWLFRSYEIGAGLVNEWNFGGVLQTSSPEILASATWRNYWHTAVEFDWEASVLSDNQTRGGPLMRTGSRRTIEASLSGNPAHRTQWEGDFSYYRDALGGRGHAVSALWSVRPRERWEISLGPDYSRERDTRQFITSRSGGSTATFGRRYIFATVERSELALSFRSNYAFTPNLSLEAYAEPFTASGRFHSYGELASARGSELRRYGAEGTTIERTRDGELEVTDNGDRFTLDLDDFTVRSFRTSTVLRWEWRRGSTVFLVWQQRLSSETTDGRLVGPKGLWDALSARGDNIIAVKVSYWIPVS